ncbi:hypothetical protein LCGC14_2763230 [marine sediment metagenome]|uniref:HNH nuclease domain-containing protein n=1 Tax=marine sediment metagenome TaxID=412755 RepID=A0A0F9B705_9ZZZZ
MNFVEVERKFWSRVKVGKLTQCWAWQSTVEEKGYGRVQFKTQGRQRTWHAHRVAWLLTYLQPIPEGIYIRHTTCYYPACCNPTHVAPGTPMENTQDRIKQGRRGSHGGGRPRK